MIRWTFIGIVRVEDKYVSFLGDEPPYLSRYSIHGSKDPNS
ncbi:hypothetical protein Pla100_60970 [Neorhodopirellula pilleata]|uniref:Uncharacterized protein n=1 Tax=Neorhodopirellula pilleata TaxID=2714738 RepID=A0A5C5ZGY8_9BACT|nr:hypothetical protein Pla100_60970 [Neorhodopirellula pilleata]